MDKTITKNKLLNLSKEMLHILGNEPAVLRVNGSTMIVGDIHGNLQALNNLIDEWELNDCKYLLFLGDYVDRGTEGAECLLRLFELKENAPNHVFLLRGNHEDEHMNRYYGFFAEIGYDNTFLMKMHSIFQSMPVAAVINHETFCVHGGITEDTDLNHITKDNSYQLLWNDPGDKSGINRSQRGPYIREFGPDVVDSFLAANGLKRIIRAHEFQKEGYWLWFDGKLLSLFSAPNYCDRENTGAFVISVDGKLTLYIFDVK